MTHPTYDPADVPAWPAYELTVHADGKVEAAGPLVPSATHPHRHAAIGAVVEASARLGRPVRAKATEADGTVWHLVVAPDGSVGELPAGRSAAPSRKRAGKSSSRAARTAPQAPPAATAPPAEAEPAFADGLALVAEHLEAGRIEVAAELAARLDRRAADTLGVSHPDALRIREVLARISALLGDTAGGVRLFRDVAERWHYRGAHADAESAASRAVALWLQITDLDTALATGMSMVRMRNQIPGENGTALTEVLTHQSLLESQKAGATGATAATREPAVDAAPVAAVATVDAAPRVAGAGDGTAQEWAGAGPVGPVGPDQASTGWAQAPGPESSPADSSSADTSGPAEADRPETTSAVAATPDATADATADAGWAGADPADAAWVEAARAVGDTPPAWLATAGAAAGPGPVESALVGEPPLPAGSETPAWPAASPVDVTPTATEPAPTEPGGPRPVQPVHPLPSVDDGTPAWLEAAQVAAVVPPAWLDAAPEPRTPADPTLVARPAVQQAPAPQPEAPQPEVPQSEMPQPEMPQSPQPPAPRAPLSQAPAVRPAFSWDRPARDSRTGG
ncbi:hypothetical protein ACIQKE_13490 [Streptomyces griseoviridis]